MNPGMFTPSQNIGSNPSQQMQPQGGASSQGGGQPFGSMSQGQPFGAPQITADFSGIRNQMNQQQQMGSGQNAAQLQAAMTRNGLSGSPTGVDIAGRGNAVYNATFAGNTAATLGQLQNQIDLANLQAQSQYGLAGLQNQYALGQMGQQNQYALQQLGQQQAFQGQQNAAQRALHQALASGQIDLQKYLAVKAQQDLIPINVQGYQAAMQAADPHMQKQLAQMQALRGQGQGSSPGASAGYNFFDPSGNALGSYASQGFGSFQGNQNQNQTTAQQYAALIAAIRNPGGQPGQSTPQNTAPPNPIFQQYEQQQYNPNQPGRSYGPQGSASPMGYTPTNSFGLPLTNMNVPQYGVDQYGNRLGDITSSDYQQFYNQNQFG